MPHPPLPFPLLVVEDDSEPETAYVEPLARERFLSFLTTFPSTPFRVGTVRGEGSTGSFFVTEDAGTLVLDEEFLSFADDATLAEVLAHLQH